MTNYATQLDPPEWARQAVRVDHVRGSVIYHGEEWVPTGILRDSAGAAVGEAVSALAAACADAAQVHGREVVWSSLRAAVVDDEPRGRTSGVDIQVRLRAEDRTAASDATTP